MDQIPGTLNLRGDPPAIPYWYQSPAVASLAAGANAQVTLQFDQDSTFYLWKLTAFADIAGAAQTPSTRVLPLVNLTLTDSGNSGGFMFAPIPLPSIMGDGQLPYILPAPFVIGPNRTWVFGYTNFSAATTYANLRVQLHGVKYFAR